MILCNQYSSYLLIINKDCVVIHNTTIKHCYMASELCYSWQSFKESRSPVDLSARCPSSSDPFFFSNDLSGDGHHHHHASNNFIFFSSACVFLFTWTISRSATGFRSPPPSLPFSGATTHTESPTSGDQNTIWPTVQQPQHQASLPPVILDQSPVWLFFHGCQAMFIRHNHTTKTAFHFYQVDHIYNKLDSYDVYARAWRGVLRLHIMLLWLDSHY